MFAAASDGDAASVKQPFAATSMSRTPKRRRNPAMLGPSSIAEYIPPVKRRGVTAAAETLLRASLFCII